VQLSGDESVEFSRTRFFRNSRTDRNVPRFSAAGLRKFLTRPRGQSVGWDPVAVGLVEPDEAYKGKRVHKIHVAKNGDLFLETHGFRPGVISGVLLDSSTAEKRGRHRTAFRLGTRAALGWNHQQHQQADRGWRLASGQCAGCDPPASSVGRGRFHRRRTRAGQERTSQVSATPTFLTRRTPVVFARRLTANFAARKSISSAKTCCTPARTKSTTASGRRCWRERMGKHRIIAETGAGQHGVATATVCALLRHGVRGLHGHRGHAAAGAERLPHEGCWAPKCAAWSRARAR
jgi:hypothetical protein